MHVKNLLKLLVVLMSAETAAPLLNKAELAQVLRCSLPTLDSMMRRWTDFPVVEEGRNGKPWRFDALAVQTFLQGRRDDAEAAGAAKDELMQQFTLPGVDTENPGLSPADQVRLATLRRLQREEAKEAGFLVLASEVRALLTDTWTRFNREIDSGIRQALRDHNIPEATIRGVEARVNETKRRATAALARFLGESESDVPDAHTDAEPTLI